MDEATLARVCEILETDPDFFVPEQKLLRILQQEGLATDLNAETFHTQLAADDRFEFMESDEATSGLELPAAAGEQEIDLTNLGLFSGPRVKLVSREVTTDDVLSGLSRSLLQLNTALQQAWESRPEGDVEAEGLLLDALSMAEQLEQEVREVIKDQLDDAKTGSEE
jgi:hypothetical protein